MTVRPAPIGTVVVAIYQALRRRKSVRSELAATRAMLAGKPRSRDLFDFFNSALQGYTWLFIVSLGFAYATAHAARSESDVVIEAITATPAALCFAGLVSSGVQLTKVSGGSDPQPFDVGWPTKVLALVVSVLFVMMSIFRMSIR
jgi:hypothetical protein